MRSGPRGDVNGDGYADVIVGARLNDAGGTNAGRAYVFYGGSGADSLADLTLTGAAAGDQFGMSVGSAGDFNGDGKSDVLVGAPLNDAGGTDAGRAYVFYGGPGADATPDLTLTGLAAGDQYGRSTSESRGCQRRRVRRCGRWRLCARHRSRTERGPGVRLLWRSEPGRHRRPHADRHRWIRRLWHIGPPAPGMSMATVMRTSLSGRS